MSVDTWKERLASVVRSRFNKVSNATQLPVQTNLLDPLPERFRARLLSMYAGEPQLGAEDRQYPLDGISRISPEEGMWLFQLCRNNQLKTTLEIGLAYGFSTIYFLAALEETGGGHHTAVDPFQLRESSPWKGIGLQHARELKTAVQFSFVPEMSFTALVDFAKQDRRFDLIFIDGGHTFDTVLLDFTLAAPLCPKSGYIVLDDTWMPSIRRVVAFIRANRPDFAVVDSTVDNIAVFRRTGPDAREWDHFVEF